MFAPFFTVTLPDLVAVVVEDVLEVAPALSPVLASTVPFFSSISSSVVGGRPWSTRCIMVCHSFSFTYSYQVPLTSFEVVGSIAE